MVNLISYIKSAQQLDTNKSEALSAIKNIQTINSEIQTYQSEIQWYFEYLMKYKWVDLFQLGLIAEELPSEYINMFSQDVFYSDCDYEIWKLFFQNKNFNIQCIITLDSWKEIAYNIAYDNHEITLLKLYNQYGYYINRNKMLVFSLLPKQLVTP